MTKTKKENPKPIECSTVVGFIVVTLFMCLFILVYLPLFITDIVATAQGIPFRHAEMDVYKCDSVKKLDSIEIMEKYTIFKGGYGDRLISNEDYYYDHCKESYDVTSDAEWCCFHYNGD